MIFWRRSVVLWMWEGSLRLASLALPKQREGRTFLPACAMCTFIVLLWCSFLDGSYLLLWGPPAAATNLLSDISCPTPFPPQLVGKRVPGSWWRLLISPCKGKPPEDQGHPRNPRGPPSRMERVSGATASVHSPDFSPSPWYCSHSITFWDPSLLLI